MSMRLADRSFQYPVGITENMLVEVVIRVKQKQLNLGVGTERMIFNIDSAVKHSYLNDDTCFSIDVIDEILNEDFDALLDEGSKILHFIKGALLEEEIFAEFNEFMAIIADENSESESDTEEPHQKSPSTTNYKIKNISGRTVLRIWNLKPLPDNLEYVFLEEPSFLPVNHIISAFQRKEKQTYDKKPIVQKQRRLNSKYAGKVVKKEIVKLLDTKLVQTRSVTGWRVCIDYRKLNEATAKDHFPLPCMDQMLERLAGNKYFCFLEGECLLVYLMLLPPKVHVGNLSRYDQRIRRRKMSLHGQKGIVLGHKVSSAGLEVDKAKIDVISKLPPPTNIKGIRSFLGHPGFYRRFIKDFSKIARPLTKLLEKDTPFEFDDECQKAFELLKEKLTRALVIVGPNWNLPFELMCDASDFAVGVVLGQKDGKNFHPIYFASKTLNPTQQKYTVTEKELMAVVFAFEKFRTYLILSKTIIHIDHSALRHLFKKQDAKPRLIRWILVLQEFNIEIKDRKGTVNVAADHLSRIENGESCNDSEVDDNFP
ncbi:reverse transcriptase domain-containing protein [Tanacetum coccineum]|uniref:Reverse transcriptase domain-containing protein n=1 Tax=Tanacetum coccineum TaxID=301880 RepID=A0ABQ4ZIS3_9ASTR